VYVREVKDIPTEPHFAVLLNESFSYDDGFGERGIQSTHTHREVQYLAFANVEQVQQWVKEQDGRYNQKPFKVIEVRPCTVTREVHIGIHAP